MKLFTQLFVALLLGMVLLIGCDEYFNYRLEVDQFRKDMVASGERSGRLMATILSHVWQESGKHKALALVADADREEGVEIAWSTGETLSLYVSEKDLSAARALLPGEVATFEVYRSSIGILRTLVGVETGEGLGYLVFSQNLDPLRAYAGRILGKGILVGVLLVMLTGTILFLFFSYKIKRPLAELAAQAKRIGEGDFQASRRIVGNDELANLGKTMNEMCSRLLIAKEKIHFEHEARLKTIEQLRHTERLSSFGLIAAGIAHEIGTPLNVVDGRAKMIARERLDEEEVIECAAIIQGQVERITTIVRQLLDFTRRPVQQIRELDLGLLVRQVFQLLEPMASKQGVSFSFTREQSTDGVLHGDAGQIQQVLVNLLLNAIQAMPDGGRVRVCLSEQEGGTDETGEGMVIHRPHVRIRISDEGEGIRKEHLERIFTPFFTTKARGTGTGLGLSIAHGIVEEHGGWIEVESEQSAGACFSILLPKQGVTK